MKIKDKLMNTKLIKQLINFGAVGVLAFFVELASLNVFKIWILPSIIPDKTEHFYILLAAPIAFCISALFNYILSILFVFKKRNDISSTKVFIIFIILNIGALALNELFMWLFATKLFINYNISKVFSTGLVTIYNFISRKIFIEDHNKKTVS